MAQYIDLPIEAGTASDSFTTMQPITGTSPVADSSTDTLTFTSSDSSVSIAGNSATDTLDFTVGVIPVSKSGNGFPNSVTTVATTGTINNLAYTTSWIRFTGNAATTLNGLVAATGGTYLVITNAMSGGAILSIANEAAASTAANRINTSSSTTVSVNVKGTIVLRYDNGYSRWIVASAPGQEAGSAFPGWVSTSTQSFNGEKTFNTGIRTNTIKELGGSQVIAVSAYQLLFGGNTKMDWSAGTLYASPGSISIDFVNYTLKQGGLVTLDWGSWTMFDNSGQQSLSWISRELTDSSGSSALWWGSRDLVDSSLTSSLNWQARQGYDNGNIISYDWQSRILYDSSGLESISWGPYGRYAKDTAGSLSFDYESRYLYDSGNLVSVDWQDRWLSDSTGIMLNWNGGIGFFGYSPVLQQTTGVSAASFSSGLGIPVTDQDTWDGYTIGQVVAALRNYGLLA